MRPILYPFQKLILIIIYAQTWLQSQPQQYTYFLKALTIILLFLSHLKQGQKLYTPFVILTVIFNLFNFYILKMIFLPLSAIAMLYLKIYQLQIVDQGEYKVGYKRGTLDNGKYGKLHYCVFYPTAYQGDTIYYMKDVPFHKRIMYDILHLDPQQPTIIPRFLFNLLTTYQQKMVMPVSGNAQIHSHSSGEGYQIIIWSHGAGGTMHTYSTLASHWASKGKIVVSIHHQNDRLQVTNTQGIDKKDINQVAKYLYNWRGSDLQIRAIQFNNIYQEVDNKQLLSKLFEEKIKIKGIYLSGHSYGGATVMEAMAKSQRKSFSRPLLGVILLDPWLFPLSPQSIQYVHNIKVLISYSDQFLQVLPQYNKMQQKLKTICQKNKDNIKCILIEKITHQCHTDCVYFSGKTAQLFRLAYKCSNAGQMIGLIQINVQTFFNDYSEQQIIQKINEYAEITHLKDDGVYARKQFRFTRQQTIKHQQSLSKKFNLKKNK